MLPLVFLSCVVAAGVVARPPPPAVEEPQALEIDDTYIIKFKDDIPQDVIKNHTSWIQSTTKYNEDGTVSQGIRHIFSLAFDGYSAVLDKETVRQVRHSPEVSYVNTVGTSIPPKTVLTLADPAPGPQIQATNRVTDDNFNPELVQTDPYKGWNANRISHRDYKASNYVPGPYIHDGYQGQGVNVYVLDTGINLAQPGFKGSTVSHGKNFVRGTGPSDINGHGTMCAGVIAGNYAGLAPKANTTNVKIANDQDRAACDDTVAGIEWVVNQPGNNNMKVISMSQTGFTGRPDVSTAVAAAVRKGVHVVVCAGNFDVDACNTEPGNAPGAIVVGSVDAYNKFPTKMTQPEGTNVGKCVTIFAPGSKVPTLSAKNISPDYRYWAWGTSIAAPQVAALVANQLSRVGPQKPEEIRRWLVKTATKGQIVGDLRGSPNLIAFSGVGDNVGGNEGVEEQERNKSGRTTSRAINTTYTVHLSLTPTQPPTEHPILIPVRDILVVSHTTHGPVCSLTSSDLRARSLSKFHHLPTTIKHHHKHLSSIQLQTIHLHPPLPLLLHQLPWPNCDASSSSSATVPAERPACSLSSRKEPSLKSTFQLSLRTTSRMLRLMANTSSWRYGIPLDRRITTDSDLCLTQIRMSSLFASPSTLQIPSTTCRKSGSPKYCISAQDSPSSWSVARRI